MRTYTRKQPNHQLIENVHELCRLCLQKSVDMVPIFTDDTNNVCAVLALRIMICVGLEMKREDSLPNVICSECYNCLNKYYTFRKKCEVSYQKLKSHLLAAKWKQYEIELEQKNETVQNKNTTETEEEMKLIVTFDKNDIRDVNMLNLNGVANKLSDQNQTRQREVNNMETIPVNQNDNNQTRGACSPNPDITTFLSTMLHELGILTHQSNGLIVNEQNIDKMELETGDGSQVTFDLIEEDEPEQGMAETIIKEDITEQANTSEQLNTIKQSNATEQSSIIDVKDVVKYVTSNNISIQAAKKNELINENNTNNIKKIGSWCDVCSKLFASRSALKRHLRIHSGEKPYTCQNCGRSFSQKEVLLRHALVHQEKRPFACARCPKSFTQRGALAAHARAHVAPHLALHLCARCPKVFLHASGLSRHMMMHAGRVYVCGACDRQFRDKSSLLRHLKNTNHAAAEDSTT